MQASSPPAVRRDEVRRYWSLVRRHMLVLVAVLVAMPAGAYALTTRIPPVHEARATLRVEATTVVSTVFSNAINVTTSDANEVARLLQTTAVARLAAEELGDGSAPGSLLGAISVELDETGGLPSPFLTIVARDESPRRAAAVANAFADALTDRRTRDAVAGIERAIDALEAQGETIPAGDRSTRDSIVLQIQELRALRATQGETTQVIEPASPPGAAISPNPTRNGILGGVLGVLLCAALIPLLDRFDRRLIRAPEDLEEIADVPLLAIVPLAKRRRASEAFLLEAFQTLRASLMTFSDETDLTSLMIVSPGRGDGKSTVASNLAFALADQGREVILVDGDMRRAPSEEPTDGRHPERGLTMTNERIRDAEVRLLDEDGRQLGVVGVDDALKLADKRGLKLVEVPGKEAGLSGVLLGGQPLEQALVEFDAEGPGRVRLLPPGWRPQNPGVLLASESMRSLLADLGERADAVVIDTPPLLAVSDAVPLLDRVSGVILVARMDHTRRDGVLRARQLIATAHGNLLGMVANGTVTVGPYGYGYGEHGYGGKDMAPAVGRSVAYRSNEPSPVSIAPAGRERYARSASSRP